MVRSFDVLAQQTHIKIRVRNQWEKAVKKNNDNSEGGTKTIR